METFNIFLVFLFLAAILAIIFGVVYGVSSGNVTPVPTLSPSNSPTPTLTVTPVYKTILFDTFEQAGVGSIPLSSHTPQVGGPWASYNSFPELELILGQGYCTNNTMTVDINQACPCNYDNTRESLEFTIYVNIPSTITPAGDLAGLALGFANSAGNGLSLQFFYDPTALSYALQIVQLTGGITDLVITNQVVNTPPPLDQNLLLSGFMKPSGELVVTILNARISGQGAYSPMADDFNTFVCALFRGNPIEIINMRMEEVLLRAI